MFAAMHPEPRATPGVTPLSLSLPNLWLALAVALPVLGALITPMSATDLAYHLRAGAEILSTGLIPTADTWTFTVAGSPWADQQWGAQAILAAIYQVGGWAGLLLLRAILIGATFGMLAVAIGRRNPGLGQRSVALLVLAAFVVATPALALRPQLFGIVLLALTLALISDRGRRPGRLWLIPAFVIAWANLHGSFVLAPVVLGLAWLEDRHERTPRANRTLLVALVAGLTSFVNPVGPAVWGYAAGLTLDPSVTGRITEWQPLTLRDGPGLLFWGSVAAVVVVVARRRATTPWPALISLGSFAFLAAYAARGLAWWPLAAAVVVAGLLPAAAPPGREPRRSTVNGLIVAAVLGVGLLVSPAWRSTDPGTGAPRGALTEAPAGVTAALRDLALQGDRLWNPQPWGSWFEFALPGMAVAVDSRIELIPEHIWQDFDAVRGVRPGWEAILDRHEVTIVVTANGDDDLLAGALAADAGWREQDAGAEGAIWVRVDRPFVP